MPIETIPAVQKEILRICRKYGVTFSISGRFMAFKGGTLSARMNAKDEVDKFIHALVAKIKEEKGDGLNERDG
jgi:hypothetical protein